MDDIVSHVVDHSDWDILNEDSYRKDLSHVDHFTNRDYYTHLTPHFSHVETDGILKVRAEETMRGSGEYWDPRLHLDQNLRFIKYLTITPTGEDFSDRLSQVYLDFEEQHGSGYTTGPGSPTYRNKFYPSRARIPFAYDEAKVDAALTSISEISREIEGLHDEIQEPVDRRLV